MASTPAKSFLLNDDYVVLRPLSLRSAVYFCRERASQRLLVIKLFSPAQEKLFSTECESLLALEGSDLAPRLYFARLAGGQFALGSEWIPGHSLLEGQGQWSPSQRREIAKATYDCLGRLHRDYHLAHLDLSPSNIFAREISPAQWKITFIDWEAAGSLHRMKMSDHGQRGTPGFRDDSTSSSLAERDHHALRACVAQLLGETAPARAAPPTSHVRQRRLLPWI